MYRSKKSRVIAGVCGGIAENLHVKPIGVRFVAAILCFMYGIGILLYIALWLILPNQK